MSKIKTRTEEFERNTLPDSQNEKKIERDLNFSVIANKKTFLKQGYCST
jgi:hypothetical protein